MLTDIEKVIREYLPQVLHMSLATCDNNQPWVCEVHFIYDESLNLYFRSKQESRHCREIKKNPHVSGNIVRQHTLTDKPRGVYFDGQAELLTNVNDLATVYQLYEHRFGASHEDVINEANKPDGKKFFKITVKKFYVFDAIESNPSKKYELAWEN